MVIRDRIDQEIYELGAVLIDSPFFERSKKQIHHNSTTLYEHVLDATRIAVMLCDICGNRKLEREKVILATLCHDLGMIGRDEKYSNDVQMCFAHPVESAVLAKKFFPDMDEATLQMIRKHMWPLSVSAPPACIEEWIVIQADKEASVGDVLHISPYRMIRRPACSYRIEY